MTSGKASVRFLVLSPSITPSSLCSICGTLHSVDQYLNIKLTDISVTDPEKYPHMLSVKNCFIRGSVVRYVQLPADEVDTQLLQDAARKEVVNPR